MPPHTVPCQGWLNHQEVPGVGSAWHPRQPAARQFVSPPEDVAGVGFLSNTRPLVLVGDQALLGAIEDIEHMPRHRSPAPLGNPGCWGEKNRANRAWRHPATARRDHGHQRVDTANSSVEG